MITHTSPVLHAAMERLMDLDCALDDTTDVRVLGTLIGACAVALRSFPTTAQVGVPSM
jgi:hypothetical protein